MRNRFVVVVRLRSLRYVVGGVRYIADSFVPFVDLFYRCRDLPTFIPHSPPAGDLLIDVAGVQYVTVWLDFTFAFSPILRFTTGLRWFTAHPTFGYHNFAAAVPATRAVYTTAPPATHTIVRYLAFAIYRTVDSRMVHVAVDTHLHAFCVLLRDAPPPFLPSPAATAPALRLTPVLLPLTGCTAAHRTPPHCHCCSHLLHILPHCARSGWILHHGSPNTGCVTFAFTWFTHLRCTHACGFTRYACRAPRFHFSLARCTLTSPRFAVHTRVCYILISR